MPSDTTTTNLHRSDGGALKGGLSRPLALLTKTWLVAVHPLSSRLTMKLCPGGWPRPELGEHHIGRRQFLSLLIGSALAPVSDWSTARCQRSGECVLSGAVSKLWKVVC